MRRCARKILLIFGLILIVAFLFIPYKSVHIKHKLDPHSLAHYKITAHKSGYMFVFKYLKFKAKKKSAPKKSVLGTDLNSSSTDLSSYSFNKTVFIIEMIVITLLAAFDFFIFCVVLRKGKSGQK